MPKPISPAAKERLREYYQRQLAALDNPRSAFNTESSPAKEAASAKRNLVWKHNSFIGHVMMMRANLNSIITASTTTTESKHYASTILGLIPKLQNSLAARVDPGGPAHG